VELQTDRLEIRTVGSIEPELLHCYLVENREAHARWEPIRDDDYYTLEGLKARFRSGDFAPDKPTERRFALLSKEEGNLIGIINFTNIVAGAFHACHLGFSIASNREGLGLMREGLQATITLVFDSLELNRIMANFQPSNFRSARLLSGLGFRVEGFAKDYLLINGVWEDHILTSLLRRDWYSFLGR
jgi:ribosomal-protein-alanine N-acetyltransferase